MARYHLADDRILKCRAIFKKCPYEKHFNSEQEGYSYLDRIYEQEQKEKERAIKEVEREEFRNSLKREVQSNLFKENSLNERYHDVYDSFIYMYDFKGDGFPLGDNRVTLFTNISSAETEALESFADKIDYEEAMETGELPQNEGTVRDNFHRTYEIMQAYKSLQLDSKRANLVGLTNSETSYDELANKIIVDKDNKPINLYYLGIAGKETLNLDPVKVTEFTGWGIKTEYDPNGVPLKLGAVYSDKNPDENTTHSKRAIFAIDDSVKGLPYDKEKGPGFMDKTPHSFNWREDSYRDEVQDFFYVDTALHSQENKNVDFQKAVYPIIKRHKDFLEKFPERKKELPRNKNNLTMKFFE